MVRPGAQWDSIPGHVCLHCSSLLKRRSFDSRDEGLQAFRARHYCDLACYMAARVARGIRLRFREDGWVLCPVCAEYKPVEAYAENKSGTRRGFPTYCRECQTKRDAGRPGRGRKTDDWLKDYPYPGIPAPVDVLRPLATEILQSGLGLARDVLVTVPETQTGLATPYFSSEARAKLWNQMIYTRTGRRSWELEA